MDGLAGGYVTVCVRTGMEPSKLGRTRGTLMLQCSTPRRKIPRPTPSPTPAAGPEAGPPLRRQPNPIGLPPAPNPSPRPRENNIPNENTQHPQTGKDRVNQEKHSKKQTTTTHTQSHTLHLR